MTPVASWPRITGACARPVHLMQLRMADAGRELPHDDLRRARVGQCDFFDAQRRLLSAAVPRLVRVFPCCGVSPLIVRGPVKY